MNDRRDDFGPDRYDAGAFVDGVLGRTSGRACGRAQEQLDDLLDGRLAGLDRQLVQAHLEHCAGCREVAVALGWLGPLLPAMAELDPGPAFLAGVLARTSGAHRPPSLNPVPDGAAGLMDRLGRWWEKQILRPAFATQLAYAATVVLVLVFSAPPLRGVPGRALEIVTAGPTAVPGLGPAMIRIGDWTESGTADLVNGGRGHLARGQRELAAVLDRRNTRAAAAKAALDTHLKTMTTRARDGELSEAGYEFLAALRSGRALWSVWWNDPEQQSGP